MRRIRAVAFDLMDTVVTDPYRGALEAATGLTLGELFDRKPPNVYPAFERGDITEEQYWTAYGDVGIDVDPEAFHRARLAGYTLIPGMRELLQDLEGVVPRVAASNYPDWVEPLTTTGVLAGCFDQVVASVHLGARKPDEAFYLRLLDRLELAADEVFFVDDRPANVEGAAAAGLRAEVFSDAGTLRRQLAEIGVRAG